MEIQRLTIDCNNYEGEFCRLAGRYLAPGGVYIVEDIDETAPETGFRDAVSSMDLAFAAFLHPLHERQSRGWKNHKLLVLATMSLKRGAD